jgi:hypothetical protein
VEELLCGMYCLKLLIYFPIDRINGLKARTGASDGSEMTKSRFDTGKCFEKHGRLHVTLQEKSSGKSEKANTHTVLHEVPTFQEGDVQ